MNLIIFGPQASGKGTQAEKIASNYQIIHISTGDIFRNNISKGTELGRIAKEIINKGNLVPDNKKNVLVPIVGFGTEYEDKKMKSIIQDFLSRDGLTERDFVIQQIKGLSSFGEQRPLYVSLKNLSVGSLKADDLNKGKYKLKVSFSLPKGSYATNVLKSLVS